MKNKHISMFTRIPLSKIAQDLIKIEKMSLPQGVVNYYDKDLDIEDAFLEPEELKFKRILK